MSRDSLKITDPALSDYFYSVFYNADIVSRAGLPPKYLKLLRLEKTAKKFALESSMDEKIMILNYLGIKFFLVIADRKIATDSPLKGIMQKYKDRQEMLSLKEIIDSGLYVTSNKQLTGLLGLVSQACGSKQYKMNLEYTRVRYHAKQWDQRLRAANEDKDMQEQKEMDVNFVRTLCRNNLIMRRSEDLFGITETQMEILTYLYGLSGSYTRIETIWDFYSGVLTQNKVTIAARRLLDLGHLDQHPFSQKREYTITGTGIKLVNQLKEAIHKLNTFSHA